MRTSILMPTTNSMIRSCPDSKPGIRQSAITCYFFKLSGGALFAFMMLLAISCEEGATKIGSGMLPGEDFVTLKSTDTISIRSFTVYDRAVKSDKMTLSYLGKVYDPYFGVTTAEFVTQIRLGSEWPGGTFTVDSVKLILTFLEVRGNAASQPLLRISEISDMLHVDSTYYSDRPVQLTGYNIADIRLPVMKADTINPVVLDLPVEFGEYLLRDTTKLFHSNSVPDFRDHFRGLYFRLYDQTDPLLLSLRQVSTTGIGYYGNYFVIFYHNAKGEQKQYLFVLDAISVNARYNRFEHDFSAADPARKIQHINNGISDTVSFIQSLSGVYTKIYLPGLDSLKNNPLYSGIAVNKAVLKIPIFYDDDIYKPSTIPSQLHLAYRTSDNKLNIVPDYSISPSYFGGRADTVNNIYKFNVASYVQNYLRDNSGKMTPGLHVLLPANESKNLILRTGSNNKPVEFELTFTRY